MYVEVTSRDETQALGEALGRRLAAGDLLMLRGGLGAGKTTFAQGIGRGMKVRGQVSSPTFIVARVHPSLVGGPDLIHADAYRINGLDDLETLDLDSTIDECVTIVEWGEGKTEAMSDTRLEVDVTRPIGGAAQQDGNVIDLEHMDDGRRRISFHPHGNRWAGVIETVAADAGLIIIDEDSAAAPYSINISAADVLPEKGSTSAAGSTH